MNLPAADKDPFSGLASRAMEKGVITDASRRKIVNAPASTEARSNRKGHEPMARFRFSSGINGGAFADLFRPGNRSGRVAGDGIACGLIYGACGKTRALPRRKRVADNPTKRGLKSVELINTHAPNSRAMAPTVAKRLECARFSAALAFSRGDSCLEPAN